MKAPTPTIQSHVRRLGCVAALAATLGALVAGCSRSGPEDSREAERAWQEFVAAAQPPMPPAEWNQQPPAVEQVIAFRQSQGRQAVKAAGLARDFYTRFPHDPNAPEARRKEYELLDIAVVMGGQTDQIGRLHELETARLADPSLSATERFELTAKKIQKDAIRRQAEGPAAVMEEFEKGARRLQKEFPGRPEVFEMLLVVAQSAPSEKVRAIAAEVLAGPASAEVKAQAQHLLDQLAFEGRPLELKFTALDGREADAARLRGKVLLLDFWATWCGPCVAELPNVLAAYEKLGPRGFEIIGVSLDQDRATLERFITEKKMTWPQHFDGKGWENEVARQFGIQRIPAMWLVDKQGVIRDVNGRENFAAKVEKLLAE